MPGHGSQDRRRPHAGKGGHAKLKKNAAARGALTAHAEGTSVGRNSGRDSPLPCHLCMTIYNGCRPWLTKDCHIIWARPHGSQALGTASPGRYACWRPRSRAATPPLMRPVACNLKDGCCGKERPDSAWRGCFRLPQFRSGPGLLRETMDWPPMPTCIPLTATETSGISK